MNAAALKQRAGVLKEFAVSFGFGVCPWMSDQDHADLIAILRAVAGGEVRGRIEYQYVVEGTTGVSGPPTETRRYDALVINGD